MQNGGKTNQPWSVTTEDALKIWKSKRKGLSATEATQRLRIYGKNTLSAPSSWAGVIEFGKKFLNPLILTLIVASAISMWAGQKTDFFIILGIIFSSSIIDYFQEHQAQNAARKLRQKVSLTATVLRGNSKEEIPANHLVPGDIILLSVGDIVPADARLLESRDLMVGQSSLTGESFPQEKLANKTFSEFTPVNERSNMIWMGTTVISGEAAALVTATGSRTLFGGIAQKLTIKRPPTEFERGINQFSYFLMKTTAILAIVVFLINAVFRHSILESLLFSLAITVGLTPSLLPMIITICLSEGASRMAKKHVIVKDLPAIQNFGSMDVLCMDKTGTLTEDKIRLERYENPNEQEDIEVLRLGYLNSRFQSGIKSPLETAILAHHEISSHGYKKLDELPFDFERRCLSVLVQSGKTKRLITQGAPENIFEITTHYNDGDITKKITPAKKKQFLNRFRELSRQGFRVIGLAYRDYKSIESLTKKDESNMIYLGLMAFLDPPKSQAESALKELQQQGVDLKILTGDNEFVTRKICEDLNLKIEGIVTGAVIDKLNDNNLNDLVAKTTIFARLNPSQKERIISSLKRHNHVVGFLGDGINDAPSLRASDVGISVNNGVDVAKEAADIILLQKDLHVLKDGIYEGRQTFANTMKYVMMGTSSNFGNMFSVAGASLFLPFLPMLPVQILLNNFLYDFSQLVIPSDSIDPEELKKPARWNIHFIRRFMISFGPISSLFDFLTFGVLLYFFHASASMFQTGWFLESLITQTLIILSIRTRRVPFFSSRPSRLLAVSLMGIVAIALILPFSKLALYFSFTILPINYLVLLAIFVFCYFVLVERTKKIFYNKFNQND